MKHITSKQSYIRAIKGSLLGIFTLLVLFHGSVASASTPTLSLTPTGDGNSVQVSVYGDANASVLLNYTRAGIGTQTLTLGTITYNGTFSTTLSTSAYGIAAGSTVYVTTNGPYGTYTSSTAIWPVGTTSGGLTFSQNNVSVPVGQTISVTVFGGNGIYTVTNNSSPSIVQASVSGSTILLSILPTGLISYSPTTSFTVCSSYTTNMCGVLYATAGNSTSGSLTFSQTNPTLSINQTTNISIYGGTYNSYYISSNSNSNAVSATVTNSTLVLTGINTGSSSIVVCVLGNNSNCGTITATTNYNGGNGTIVLSQTSLTLTPGQTSTINISGSGSYYVSSNTNQTVATPAISGNTMTVYAGSTGTTSINICQYSGSCAILYVTVSGNGGGTVGNSYLTFSTPNPTLSVGQSTVVYITGGQGSGYTIPYNSSAAAVATVSGNTLSITGRQNGYAVMVICDAYNDCGPVTIAVGGGIIPPPTNPGGPIVIIFTSHLYVGLNSPEVLQLQRLLTTLGIYSGSVDGHFGLLTQSAVKRYQSSHGLYPDGDVGAETRAQLNTGR